MCPIYPYISKLPISPVRGAYVIPKFQSPKIPKSQNPKSQYPKIQITESQIPQIPNFRIPESKIPESQMPNILPKIMQALFKRIQILANMCKNFIQSTTVDWAQPTRTSVHPVR